MTGPEERTGDGAGGAAGGDAWTSRRVPSALGAVSDAVLDALGDVIAMAGSEARRDAETRLATALEELDAARMEAEACRLRMEEMARERAILEAEIGSGMATMEASMKRIRSALVKAAVTPDGDATETTAPETTEAPTEARGESRSDIGAAEAGTAGCGRASRRRPARGSGSEPGTCAGNRQTARTDAPDRPRFEGRARDQRRLCSARGRRRHRSHRPDRRVPGSERRRRRLARRSSGGPSCQDGRCDRRYLGIRVEPRNTPDRRRATGRSAHVPERRVASDGGTRRKIRHPVTARPRLLEGPPVRRPGRRSEGCRETDQAGPETRRSRACAAGRGVSICSRLSRASERFGVARRTGMAPIRSEPGPT